MKIKAASYVDVEQESFFDPLLEAVSERAIFIPPSINCINKVVLHIVLLHILHACIGLNAVNTLCIIHGSTRRADTINIYFVIIYTCSGLRYVNTCASQ